MTDIRKASQVLFLLSVAVWGAVSSSGTAFGEETPKKIKYFSVRSGTTKTRTGLEYESKKVVLAGADRPEGKRWLTYEPSEGYDLEALGLQIKPSTTLVMQGSPNPNTPPGSGKFAQSWVMYLDFIKKLEDWGQLFVQFEPGWGLGVDPDLALFSGVDHNAHDTGGRFLIRKYWYEQYFLNKQVTVRCGVLHAIDWFDLNNYVDDDDNQFLGYPFNNSPAIEWASGCTFAEHIHMAFEAAPFIELDLGHFEGSADWQQLFKNGMYIAQGNIKPSALIGADPVKWGGNYRFYGWVNDRDHLKYVEAGQMQGNESYINYGLGLSFDQIVANAFDLFGRFGWERPDIIPVSGSATVEWAWSGGIQVSGKYWARAEDHIAVAVGQDFVSKEYKDAGNPGSNEGHIEAYYSWRLNRCLTISPDLQLIWNPNGVSKAWQGNSEPVFVYSTRIHYVF